VRIVFDTNVLARAHQLSHGPARRGLLFVATGSDVLILSQYLLQELRRILTYPRILRSSGADPSRYFRVFGLPGPRFYAGPPRIRTRKSAEGSS